MSYLDGAETRVEVTVQLPGEDQPVPITGLIIIDGMTEDQIRSGMNMAASMVIRRLMEQGAMKYSAKPREFISFAKKLEQTESK